MTTIKTIRMKAADLKAWLEALRSGKYKQAKGKLERDGGYCCLGVMQHCLTGSVEKTRYGAHMESAAVPTRDWLETRGIEFKYTDLENDDSTKLIPSCYPMLSTIGLAATSANDGRDSSGRDSKQYSFAEIADAIEACTETY